jgi:virulence factor Mce-like protein
MIKQAPPLSRIVAMIAFALSCFGILLYLWVSFGGVVPLKPKGYRFTASFTEASLLVPDADVRISGVNVGRVIRSERVGGVARAVVEVDARYAPIPRDTRVTLRQKTLVGETYVELTPGSPRRGMLPDGGSLPPGQASETAEVDEILRTVFDPETRRSTQRGLQGLARGLRGRAADLSGALGNAGPLTEESGDVLRILDDERESVRRLIRDAGFVLSAAGRRQGELSGVVRAVDTVLSTTARRNAELAETVRILPTTLRELQPTFAEIEAISGEAAPLVRELRPAGRALGPALVDAAALAPELEGLFRDLDAVLDISPRALPALTRTVNAARPVFQGLAPALRELVPVVDFLGLYKQEGATFFANLASTTQGSEVASDGVRRHYLRALVPTIFEGFVVNEERLGTNRHNPYPVPRWLDKLAGGLESIDCQNAGNFAPAGTNAPPCKVQQPLTFRGRSTAFPQLKRDP